MLAMRNTLADLKGHDVVFFHHTKQPRELLRQMVRAGKIPTVAFGLPEPEIRCLTVDHDPTASMRRAVGYLAGLGYRRIAFAGSSAPWGRLWLDGYRRGLKAGGLAFDANLVALNGAQTQAGGAQCAAALRERRKPCEVILADSDMRALGVVEYLRQEGVKVPQDVGVMGYDGLDNAVQQPPFLTTLRLPFAQMIRAALAEVDACGRARSPNKHLKFTGAVAPGQTVMQRNG
jgi:DNA-binding LacI/PurR family transcriptional regulator